MTHPSSEDPLIRPGAREGEQLLPVNVLEVDNDIVVVVPMPGMEPENVEIVVSGKVLTLSAGMRGPGQRNRHYIRHEWTYGPYHRRVELPFPVDAEHANASLGNGVLTLTLPKAQAVQPRRRIELKKTGTSEGHHEGHIGHEAITR